MKKFKVIVLSLGGLGNRIFESGDVVSEDAFPAGSVEKLVEQGFLEPFESDEGSDMFEGEENDPATPVKDELPGSGNAKESDPAAPVKDELPESGNTKESDPASLVKDELPEGGSSTEAQAATQERDDSKNKNKGRNKN